MGREFGKGAQLGSLSRTIPKYFEDAVKNLLNENSGEWVICGEATNGEDAVTKVAKLRPDVILLDLSIPLLHGVKVAEILKRDHPSVVIIVMTEQEISDLTRLAEASGTQYCIEKSRAAVD